MLIEPRQSIVFEGDSNTSRRIAPAMDTWPYLRINNWDVGYPERFGEWLFCNRPDLEIRCLNAAAGGSTIRNVQSRYETVVKPAKPNWLVFTLTGNDSRQQIPMSEFTEKVEWLCRRVKEDSNGRLIWVDVIRPDSPEEKITRCRPYGKELREILARFDGLVIPAGEELARKEAAIRKLWDGHTLTTGPDGHLNMIAAEIISTLLLQTLGVLTLNR